MEPSLRAACAVAALILIGAPLEALAADSKDAVLSGTDGSEHLPVTGVTLDGSPTAAHSGSVADVEVRFIVSGPGALTHEGTLVPLAAGDDVRLEGYTGSLRLDAGRLRFAGVAAASVLCSADDDQDGLAYCDELDAGTDPDDADTDDDGLLDGEEFHGTRNAYPSPATDPLAPDSDGDKLSDGDEVAAGTDPNDADTDDGGAGDGTETTRGTDPLDPTDDFYGVYASLEGQGASRGTPLSVEWVGVNPYTGLERGDHTVAGIDLTIQHDQGQWLLHNGTETHVANGFRFTLFDFRGSLTYSAEMRTNGTQDILTFDGIARSMQVRNLTSEEEAVRTKVLLEQDTADGKLRLTTYQVVADQPVQPAQHVELEAVFPVPFYVEFDTWKEEGDLSQLGVYHVSMEPASHEGTAGYWLIIYNEDPVLYQAYIPFRAPLLPVSAVRICIMTEAPFWCGGFERA